jgi:hypothetical protein
MKEPDIPIHTIFASSKLSPFASSAALHAFMSWLSLRAVLSRRARHPLCRPLCRLLCYPLHCASRSPFAVVALCRFDDGMERTTMVVWSWVEITDGTTSWSEDMWLIPMLDHDVSFVQLQPHRPGTTSPQAGTNDDTKDSTKGQHEGWRAWRDNTEGQHEGRRDKREANAKGDKLERGMNGECVCVHFLSFTFRLLSTQPSLGYSLMGHVCSLRISYDT